MELVRLCTYSPQVESIICKADGHGTSKAMYILNILHQRNEPPNNIEYESETASAIIHPNAMRATFGCMCSS